MTFAKRQARPDPLQPYHEKRRFGVTPEPRGRKQSARPAEHPRFVVQKHQARRLHYDFRLEVGGVLKSWAVPKGPSTDPRDKRLAMATEDHPLDYAEFEGVIPAGQYGAGPVIVWDQGFYANITLRGGKLVPIERALAEGRVRVWLEGDKLRGGYALTRTGDGADRWLLVKMADEEADPARNPVATQPQSVVSGRTIEELTPPATKLKLAGVTSQRGSS